MLNNCNCWLFSYSSRLFQWSPAHWTLPSMYLQCQWKCLKLPQYVQCVIIFPSLSGIDL